ncbi:hypothetical protein ACSBR1_004048 [Camellia fascicularis]
MDIFIQKISNKNYLSGIIPSTLGLMHKFLSNNKLTGPLPNFEGMSFLNYLMMENTQLQGQIPITLFSLPQLQTLVLRNNQLNGSLDGGSCYSNQLRLIDLQHHFIDSILGFTKRASTNIEILISGNPICTDIGVKDNTYCNVQQPNFPYSTLANNCLLVMYSSNKISSPNCVHVHTMVPYSLELLPFQT